MDDRAVILMEEYIDTRLPKIEDATEPYIFNLRSCMRWAAEEILNRLIRESMKLPTHVTGIQTPSATEIVAEFVDEMEYYASIAQTKKGYDIFDIAATEGQCVLTYFEEKENTNG